MNSPGSDARFCDSQIENASSAGPSRLAAFLSRAPEGAPVAIRADGAVMTDREFLIEAGRWRERFQEARQKTTGCCRRTRVVMHSSDTTALLPALFGAWSAGVETMLTGDALPGTLARMRAAAMVEPGVDLLALDMAAFAGKDPAADGLAPVAAPDPIDAPAAALETPVPFFGVLSDEAVLCSLFTSGSTGEAKRVPKRLGQLFFETEGVARAFFEAGIRFDEPTVAVSTVTAQHIYGILFRALLPLIEPNLMADAPRTHFPEALAERMAGFAREGKKILLVSSPAHLSRFTDPHLFDASRAAVVGVSSSAGPLSAEAARHARLAFGHWPLEVLGSTETGGIARRMRAFENEADERAAQRFGESGQVDLLTHLLSAPVATPPWRPMPGVEAAVALDDANAANAAADRRASDAIAREGVGRIALKARHLADRGWTIGDDAVRLCVDKTGPAFTLLGRADRIAKIEGKRVALAEVESLLLSSGRFEAVKVFAVAAGDELFHAPGLPATPSLRDELAVVAVPKKEAKTQLLLGKNEFLASLRAELLKALSPVLIPKRWRFVDRLPANAQGKTTRAALCALFDPRRPEWLLTRDETMDGLRTIELEMRLMPNLAWFRGHFPELPILPGVAQLLLVERALHEFASDDAALAERLSQGVSTVKNLKFKAITKPGMRMRLRLAFAKPAPGEALRVKFEWVRPLGIGRPGEEPQATATHEAPHSLGILEFAPS